MPYTFSITRPWGLFQKVSNNQTIAESIYLFSTKGPRVFLRYDEAHGWAIRTIWNFYLFAFIHISEGKSTGTAGWHVNWAHLTFKKERRRLTVQWGWADLYGLDDSRRQQARERRNSRRKYMGKRSV